MAFYQAPRRGSKGRLGESRFEQMKRQGVERQMPPVEDGEYLLEHLADVGPALGTGMGQIPVTFSELEAWQVQTGLQLQPWEVSALRRLSKDYCAEIQRAASPAAMPPWVSSVEDRRKGVDTALRNVFRAIMDRQRAEQALARTEAAAEQAAQWKDSQ